jgi:hypothetical protein
MSSSANFFGEIRIYLLGVTLIFATSTSAALKANVSLGGFIAGIITAGTGLGGLKACVPPFMGSISPASC